MDRIIRVSCVVILIINICSEYVLANQGFELVVDSSKIKDEDESKIPSLLFSPRLGRKKRTLRDESHNLSDQELQELSEAFKESPLAFVAINGNEKLICKNVQGKRSSFVPRLGRNIEEDFTGNEKWLQDADNSPEYVIQRSPPFAPRLGRRMSQYSPRLGREN